MDDLRSAESRGKWWLVGAAWGGDPLAEHADALPAATASKEATKEDALLKLARKQGMNTDIRRSIFVVLMSSDVRAFCDSCVL
jgi:nucleolar MIF4G domain-containing protein 1